MAGHDDQNKRQNVRRRLFQDQPDIIDGSTLNILEEEASTSEEKKRRWNFDFTNEIPLEGDWVWEKCSEDAEKSSLKSESEEDTGEEARKI